MFEDRPILLSVIVPAFNAMDCLEKCVDSIRQHQIPNMEIIIVDDGSTDNTGALAEQMALYDKRIRVFHKENGGTSSARNLGLDNARGEYIGFVDADDYIEGDMYEKMIKAALSEHLLMVQTSRDEIDENGVKMDNVCEPPSEPMLFENKDIFRELLLHKGDCSFCTRITQRELFKELRFPEGELNEDFLLLVQMLPSVPFIGILPFQDYHVVYRMCSNTRTKDENEFSRVFTDIVVNADRVQKIVEKEYPDLLKESFRFGLFQRLDYMLHIPIKKMNRGNEFYIQVRKYLRRNKYKVQRNPYLTKRDKQYIFILGTVPKLARKIHYLKMKGRKNNG